VWQSQSNNSVSPLTFCNKGTNNKQHIDASVYKSVNYQNLVNGQTSFVYTYNKFWILPCRQFRSIAELS
jgi:hypothetical protein